MQNRKERTEFFRRLGWGVFTHYIQPTDPETPGDTRSGYMPYKTWNDRVNRFDTDRYAKTLHEIGAHYAFFTLMQGTRYFCAPNETYDRLVGFGPGEACSERDLVADLIASLKKYDIPLFLYYTGDGPYKERAVSEKFDWPSREEGPVTESFVTKWTDVMKEYAIRYGKDVKGWWVDGCYEWMGYTDALLRPYREAMLAGNPDAIIAFNNGIAQPNLDDPAVAHLIAEEPYGMKQIRLLETAVEKEPAALRALSRRPGKTVRYSAEEDFTAGEDDAFTELPPEGGMVNGSRWHTLSFLGQYVYYSPIWGGGGWNRLGSRYSGAYMRDYVKKCNARGGVVSIDCYLFDDGSFDEGQLEVLRQIEK